MKEKRNSSRKSWWKWVFLGILVILGAAWGWYVNDYYRADQVASEFLISSDQVEVTEVKNDLFFDGPGEDTALIFYPGAKVEYTSYAPIMRMLAQEGVDCFVIKMPCNLAIFGVNRADEIREAYAYENWYLSGHSLGGAMGAAYAAKHLEELDGLILLAAYPTKSLDREGFRVLSVYGSEDRVLSFEKMEEGQQYMPEDARSLCINGGNHAWFGSYGEQEGDGNASISHQEQWRQTVDAVLELMQ